MIPRPPSPRPKHAARPALVAAAIAGLAQAACAQDGGEYASVEESVLEEAAGPQNLPGHAKGERSPERADETEAPSTEATAREWFGGSPWWEWNRATGDWGGARTRLEELGLTLDASYTLEWSSVWDGGVANRASTRSILDANLTADLETLFGLAGGSVFVDFYSTDGRGGSADAGDFQGFSNIETGDNIDQIAEVWYEQRLFDDRLRIKAGKIEANSEFAFVDAAGEFINSSAGFSPTIFPMPTYPDPACGLTLFVYPTEQLYLGAGVFDGSATVDGVHTGGRGPKDFFSDDHSDDYVFLAEAGLTWNQAGALGAGRFALGAWHHTGDFTTFAGDPDSGSEGFYALVEQQLVAHEDGLRDLTAFAQYGWADPDVSEANHHIAAGLTCSGICAARPDDAAGLYCSHVDFSGQAGFAESGETALELYYLIALTPWASIKPDIQYILDPSGDPAVDDAIVATLRISVSF
ncbi:MAG: carbohydrate porin [Phycisphaerales bacterium]|nr:carbohydrate porin [Phycisphaerales bacterium]